MKEGCRAVIYVYLKPYLFILLSTYDISYPFRYLLIFEKKSWFTICSSTLRYHSQRFGNSTASNQIHSRIMDSARMIRCFWQSHPSQLRIWQELLHKQNIWKAGSTGRRLNRPITARHCWELHKGLAGEADFLPQIFHPL